MISLDVGKQSCLCNKKMGNSFASNQMIRNEKSKESKFDVLSQFVDTGYEIEIFYMCNECLIGFTQKIFTHKEAVKSLLIGCPICNNNNFVDIIDIFINEKKS